MKPLSIVVGSFGGGAVIGSALILGITGDYQRTAVAALVGVGCWLSAVAWRLCE